MTIEIVWTKKGKFIKSKAIQNIYSSSQIFGVMRYRYLLILIYSLGTSCKLAPAKGDALQVPISSYLFFRLKLQTCASKCLLTHWKCVIYRIGVRNFDHRVFIYQKWSVITSVNIWFSIRPTMFISGVTIRITSIIEKIT